MAIEFSIRDEATGVVKSFAALGISSARRSLQNAGLDSCALTYKDNLTVGDLWVRGKKLSVLRNGDLWFQGRVENPVRGASGAAIDRQIIIAGPWWYLQNLTFLQTRTFVTGTASEIVSAMDASTVDEWSSLLNLGEDETGHQIATHEQIAAVLAFAINRGAPIQVGTIETGITIPRAQARDMSCADVIAGQLRWTPDLTMAWDYSTVPPTFNVRNRTNKTIVTLALGTSDVARVDLQPRFDAKIPGVQVNFVRHHTRADGEFYTIEKDTAGDLTRWGILYASFDLEGTAAESISTGDTPVTIIRDQEAAPVGIAARVFSAFGKLHYSGTVEIHEADISGRPWMERAINITGGYPGWVDMDAEVQGVEEETFRGITTLTLGLPGALGPADLFELLRQAKDRTPLFPNSNPRDGQLPNTTPPPIPPPHYSAHPPRGTPVDATFHGVSLTSFQICSGDTGGTVARINKGITAGSDLQPQPLPLSPPGVSVTCVGTASSDLVSISTQLSWRGIIVSGSSAEFQQHAISYRSCLVDATGVNTSIYDRLIFKGTMTKTTGGSVVHLGTAATATTDVYFDASSLLGNSGRWEVPVHYGATYSQDSSWDYEAGQGNHCEISITDVLLYPATGRTAGSPPPITD